MIAKRIPREKGSSFERLARYILDAKHEGATVELARATNVDSGPEDGFAIPIAVITATQAKNTRAKTDRSYHLVVSFPAGERPSPEQLRDIEDSLVQAIGLGEHQRVSAVHTDTSHVHLHVAINKIHPVTFRLVEPYYDKLTLQKVCRELEVRHGLQRLPSRRLHEPGASRSRSTPAVGANVRAESFLRWTRTNVVPALREILTSPTATWEAFHAALARFDLELRPRGAGFVLKARHGRSTARPSDIGRELSFRALQKRLGPFVPAGPAIAEIVAVTCYRPRPIYSSPASARLFEAYQQARSDILAQREAARDATGREEQLLSHQLRDWYAERRALIRQATTLSRTEKRIAYMDLARERQADLAAARERRRSTRNTISEKHSLPTWTAFLIARAKEGDVTALEVLRAKANRGRAQAASAPPPPAMGLLLTGPDAAARASPPLLGIPSDVRQDGSIVYSLPDGGRVVDSAAGVEVAHRTPEAVRTAVTIASVRFGEAPVELRGSPDSCREVVSVAREVAPRMTFAGIQDERLTPLEQVSPLLSRDSAADQRNSHDGPAPRRMR